MDANGSTYDARRSRLEGRAIVPPIHCRISRDIIPASTMPTRSSPSPFALGVYTLDDTDGPDGNGRPLELFFVSNRASSDRSPFAHVCNLPGVLPGWYAIPEPGKYYEVRHRRINTHMPRFRGRHNVILTRLYVDGIPASRTTLYDTESHGTAIYDQVDVGFDVGTKLGSAGVLQKRLRRFRFERTNVADLSGSESESGTIHLRVKVGERIPFIPGGNWEESQGWGDCVNGRTVSGQAVEEEGRSIQTIATNSVSQIWFQSNVAANNVRPWADADIIVHIREAAWMQSRRLIDDRGTLCTHTRLKEWLEEASLRLGISEGNYSFETEWPAAKSLPKTMFGGRENEDEKGGH